MPVVIVGTEVQSDEDDIDTSPFFDYLQSSQGHEIAKSVIEIIQDFKKAALAQQAGSVKVEKYLQVGIVFAVILAVSVLSALGKLDANVGILFGTLVGYVFGRKSS